RHSIRMKNGYFSANFGILLLTSVVGGGLRVHVDHAAGLRSRFRGSCLLHDRRYRFTLAVLRLGGENHALARIQAASDFSQLAAPNTDLYIANLDMVAVIEHVKLLLIAVQNDRSHRN